MPRVMDYQDVIDHDFAWNVFVERDQIVQLFAKNFIRPQRIAGPKPQEHLGRTYVTFDEASMKIAAIGISQPGAILTLRMGDWEYTYSGFYGTPQAIRPLTVPVRQSFSAALHLLPGVDPGLVMVHLHTLFIQPR